MLPVLPRMAIRLVWLMLAVRPEGLKRLSYPKQRAEQEREMQGRGNRDEGLAARAQARARLRRYTQQRPER